MKPDWRIYYADGSMFDAEMGQPGDAPSFGAQVILVRDGRHQRRVLKFADYYLYRPSIRRWTDHQDGASALLAAAHEPWVTLICGQYLREDAFEQILIRANDDPDFAPAPAGPAHEAWKV